MEYRVEQCLIAQYNGCLYVVLGEVTLQPFRDIACTNAVGSGRDYRDTLLSRQVLKLLILKRIDL